MKTKFNSLDSWFEKTGLMIVKHRWISILLFILVLGLGFTGITRLRTNPSIDNWFLDDDPITIATKKFENIFGNDEYGGILIECEDVFTYKNLTLIRELSNELIEQVPFAEKINSITDLEFIKGTEYGLEISQIIPDEIPKSKQALDDIRKIVLSKESLADRIVSKDSKQAFIMVKFMPFPDNWQEKYDKMPSITAGKEIMNIITQEKYKPLNLKASGMPIVNHELTVAMGKETSQIMMFALIIAIVILIILIRSVPGVIIPLITSISSIIIVLGGIGFLQYEVEPTFITMPAILGIAVAIGYSIHFFNFFKRQMRKTGKRKESVVFAMRETGWPILFTALTTSGALLTFLFVPVEFIWFIGLSSAAVVLVTYLIIMSLTPALLSFGRDTKAEKVSVEKKDNFVERLLDRLGGWVIAKSKPIVITYVLVFAALAYGITKIEVTTDYNKTYGRKLSCIDMLLSVAESKLGSLYSYNLTVEFPSMGMAKDPENLRKLDLLAEEAKKLTLTKRTSSINSYIKEMNMSLNEDNAKYYTIPKNAQQVAQLLFLYENAGGTEAEYWIDYDYSFLRLMIEVQDFNSKVALKEYTSLVNKAKELFPDATVSVVGTLAQSLAMIEYLVKGQVKTFFYAIMVISILLMIVFRSIKTGLIGLIPNLAPAITIGGLMGYLDIPLDMMTVTLIPMILGLAVDDTIHFINHCKNTFDKHKKYNKSIRITFKTVGVALLFTTLILSANYATYMASKVNMLVNMGLLAVAGMFSALLSDYFITPALFKWFKVFGKEDDQSESVEIKQKHLKSA